MLDMKKKMNKLELKKIKDIEENLEKEIVEMEEISLDGSQEHLLVNNNAQQFGSPTLDQQLKDLINRQNEVSLIVARNQEKMLLPKNEPKIFNGDDLTEFKTFMNAFNVTIDQRCDNSSAKLYYLEK